MRTISDTWWSRKPTLQLAFVHWGALRPMSCINTTARSFYHGLTGCWYIRVSRKFICTFSLNFSLFTQQSLSDLWVIVQQSRIEYWGFCWSHNPQECKDRSAMWVGSILSAEMPFIPAFQVRWRNLLLSWWTWSFSIFLVCFLSDP